VVVTKDADFRNSHLLSGTPAKLLVVATGNIANDTLLSHFERSLDAIVQAFQDADFVELQPNALIVHEPRSKQGPNVP
jgi:predicted nuclease of predicted toxin-antitoxin system